MPDAPTRTAERDGTNDPEYERLVREAQDYERKARLYESQFRNCIGVRDWLLARAEDRRAAVARREGTQ